MLYIFDCRCIGNCPPVYYFIISKYEKEKLCCLHDFNISKLSYDFVVRDGVLFLGFGQGLAKISKTIEYDEFEHIDKIREFCEENDFVLVDDEPIYK